MNNSPFIFVINLEKSEDRRIAIQQQLDSKITPYTFFPAIYGKENPEHYLFKKYNEQKRLLRKGHTMSLSQLGCFASHYLLWEKCIELNQGIVILEDDAIFHENFVEVCYFLRSDRNKFDFLWLSPPAPVKRGQKGDLVLEISDTKNKVERFYEGWRNTTGYYINPIAAKKLINYMQEWVYDVDISMDRYWENGLDHLAVIPACLEPNFSLESNIPVNKGRSKRTLVTKLKREYFRLKDNINKFSYDFSKKIIKRKEF
ncbi:glycosyltransferase family 25 protein [Actinobacillus equuli]|uniref:glycosyltransferase family 25 protein n=1 Tax=Actinobacillus equuli TaxID=718 RepID=UPI00241858BB|nr:glycosyltransferase family 25 protein [Actinobacillus equuli]MDG4951947.1 glycosyltransferase family 25 protein [Actinobacillus equuli subsp. equuli]WGE83910.1 glycosyltransferase family 25 protein [Actinobacillus equuli subsp. equuli]